MSARLDGKNGEGVHVSKLLLGCGCLSNDVFRPHVCIITGRVRVVFDL